MNDFNFFSPYIEIKRTSKSKRRYVLATTFIGLAIVGSTYLWTDYRMVKIIDEISQNQEYLKSNKVINNIQDLNEKKRKIGLLDDYFHIVSDAKVGISRLDKLGTELLEKVTDCIPKDISFDMISIDLHDMQVQGSSPNRLSVAEFQFNLKETGEFAAVHVLDITKSSTDEDETEEYVFVLKCTLKDVE